VSIYEVLCVRRFKSPSGVVYCIGALVISIRERSLLFVKDGRGVVGV